MRSLGCADNRELKEKTFQPVIGRRLYALRPLHSLAGFRLCGALPLHPDLLQRTEKVRPLIFYLTYKYLIIIFPSLTVENQKPTAKPLSMRLAEGFVFVLLSGILSIFAFHLNCFHILLCDEFIVCAEAAHIM